MSRTVREELYAALPAVADPLDLDDHDVVLVAGTRFLTVAQAWRGVAGREVRCLPGALPLGLLGRGFGTNLDEVVLRPADPACVLLGRLMPGEPLVLRTTGGGAAGELARLFPGHGRFDRAETVESHSVCEGDVLILEDGAPHVLSGGRLQRLDPATWSRVPTADERSLSAHLVSRDLPVPLTRLR